MEYHMKTIYFVCLSDNVVHVNNITAKSSIMVLLGIVVPLYSVKSGVS